MPDLTRFYEVEELIRMRRKAQKMLYSNMLQNKLVLPHLITPFLFCSNQKSIGHSHGEYNRCLKVRLYMYNIEENGKQNYLQVVNVRTEF